MYADAGTAFVTTAAGAARSGSGGEFVGALGTMACMTAGGSTFSPGPAYPITPVPGQRLRTGATGSVS